MSKRELNIHVPPDVWDTRYNDACYPGMPDWDGLREGANCQQFAYEILRCNGLYVPDFRSKELWEDTKYSEMTAEFSPLDLILFNPSSDPWGAHVAVYIGGGEAIHLAKKIGFPTIWKIEEFTELPEYGCLIGGKRIKSQDNQ